MLSVGLELTLFVWEYRVVLKALQSIMSIIYAAILAKFEG